MTIPRAIEVVTKFVDSHDVMAQTQYHSYQELVAASELLKRFAEFLTPEKVKQVTT